MSRTVFSFRHKDIALKVLCYLNAHPDARDTIEGIAAWWLLEQRILEEKGKVMETLQELVDQGVLVVHRRRDAEEQFSLNREKRELIRSLLAQPGPTPTEEKPARSRRSGQEPCQ